MRLEVLLFTYRNKDVCEGEQVDLFQPISNFVGIALDFLEVNEVSIELNNSSFNDFVKKLKPTIVLFDRFLTEEQFGWRVAENCPKALRILDTEDLHFLRKVRHNQLKKGEKFTNEDKNRTYSTLEKMA